MAAHSLRPIDLLLTIVIVTVVVGLAFLTLQASVGYSRRAGCGNNTKWFLVGLQQYYDSHKMFPPGAQARRATPDPDNVSWGQSWFVTMLGSLDQGELYRKLQTIDRASPDNDYVSQPMIAALEGKRLRMMTCPSSPLPATQVLQGITVDVPSYVGIDGGGSGGIAPYGGQLANNGTLIVMGYGARNYSDVAHQLAIGEVAHWYYDDGGNRLNPALSFAGANPKTARSWLAGAKIRRSWDVYYPPQPNTVLNVVSVRHPINTNNWSGPSDKDPNWNTEGIGLCGLNNPLGSGHTRGIMAGYADGHFAFLSERMDLQILMNQAAK